MTDKKRKVILNIVFGIYFALLVFLIIFKFGNARHMRSVNLIPYGASGFDNVISTGWALRETVYNILVFIPLGVYVALFQRKRYYFLIPFVISVCFEVIQFIFAIGASDITDVIGNTIGGFIGILLWKVIHKIFPKKGEIIVLGIGLFVEIGGILLFLILVIANL